MRKSWKSFLGISLAALLTLSACGTSGETNGDGSGNGGDGDEKKSYTIGVNQIVEHPSLNAAFDGFKKALEDNGFKEGDNLTFDVQYAQGDQNNSNTIANNFVGDNVDLIFANSTPSAQSSLHAVIKANKDIPILFTSVTDPVGAKLVAAMDQPGELITGTTDTHPDAIPNTIKFISEETDAESVGLIYNPGEQNSVAQVEAVKAILGDYDLKVEEASVATSADVKQAAESLIDRADVFYIITDNTVVSALASVIGVANEKDIPVFAGEFDSVKGGAFAAYGFEYYDIGYETGVMAAKILKGEATPADLEVQYPQNLKLVMNKKAAAEQGIEIKESWNDLAEFLEE
jgi:putative tryptophan/tyrosine transport system substrate-binding protein